MQMPSEAQKSSRVEQIQMSRAERELKIKRLEQLASSRPRTYEVRVLMLALLGYSALVLALSPLVLMGLAGVYVLAATHNYVLGVLLLIVSFSALAAISFGARRETPLPDGISLTREGASRLFTAVDDVAEALGGLKVHHVFLTDELNAAAMQVRRMGFVGRKTNILVLGLPLMMVLSEAEFRAIVAHELGHLAGNHSRFTTWVYGLYLNWTSLASVSLTNGSSLNGLTRWFYFRFLPRLELASFILRRSHELAADAAAARLVGAQVAADALIKVDLWDEHLTLGVLEPYLAQVSELHEPPPGLFDSYGTALETGLDTEAATKALRERLRMPPSAEVAHPNLDQRLRSLGQSPDAKSIAHWAKAVSTAGRPSAADELLGFKWHSYAERLELSYRRGMDESWLQEHLRRSELREQAAFVESKPGKLSETDAGIAQARLLAQAAEIPKAIALLRPIVLAEPENAAALAELGKCLLHEGDASGTELIHTAMVLRPEWQPQLQMILAGHYARTNAIDKAVASVVEAEATAVMTAESKREQREIRPSDSFEPHGLNADQLRQLNLIWSGTTRLETIFFAYKRLKSIENARVPVVIMIPRVAFKAEASYSLEAAAAIRAMIASGLAPAETVKIAVDEARPWRKAFESMPEALVYERVKPVTPIR